MTSASTRCSRCGGPIAPHQRFCDQCGAPLAAVPPPSPAAGPTGPPPNWAGASPPARQSGLVGCCLAAVAGFLVVFCLGVAVVGGAVYFLGPGFSFGP